MDRFTSMTIFVKVVEGNSFAAAARHFRLSPAMVSRHIQVLEERLGAQLLNRTTRRVSPTEIGQAYYQRCRQILADIEEADAAAGDLQAAPRGILKINAPHSFGVKHLAPVVADYLATYPGVSVELTLNDRYVDLIEEGFDLAVRIGRLQDSSLIARRLASVRMVLCAAPEYVKKYGAPQRPQELTGHNCLVYTYSATPGQWHFTGPSGEEESVPVSGRLLANSGDVLKVAALKGEGIALEPTQIVGEELRSGQLVSLMPAFRPPEGAMYAVYPHSRHLSAKVRSFVDFLVIRFGRDAGSDGLAPATGGSGRAPPWRRDMKPQGGPV